MKLWRRASALFKDKNSIYLARLSRRTAFRNPELEEAVIKATSHSETSVDYKNAQRIFTWIRTSPRFVRPVLWSLSMRMEKTRSWVVALKGLMLMHGIFCCKIPSVHKLGRLPFDFSNFNDGYSNNPRAWGLSAFIRAYFAFLDQKSTSDIREEWDGNKRKEKPMVETLQELRKSQALLDLLLQVKPYSSEWSNVLVIEAMDCIVIEIFDVYSKICNAIAGVLVRIYTADQVEAETALHVLHKATVQGEELDSYFEYCRDIGVLNASEFPKVEKIPEEDIRDLERIIHEVSTKKNSDESIAEAKGSTQMDSLHDDSVELMKTVITDEWVLFEDDFKVDDLLLSTSPGENTSNTDPTDPFAASVNVPPLFYGSSSNFTNISNFMPVQHCYSSLPDALSTGGNQRNQILSM